MRQKQSKIVDEAIHNINGFEKVFKVIHQNTVLRGQSKSTFENYLRRIALLILNRHQNTEYKKFLLALFSPIKLFRSYGYARIF